MKIKSNGMKLKLDYNTNRFSVKGLTYNDLQTIATLMAYVKLGGDTAGSKSSFRIGELLELAGFDFTDMEVTASKCNGKQLEDFSLEFV